MRLSNKADTYNVVLELVEILTEIQSNPKALRAKIEEANSLDFETKQKLEEDRAFMATAAKERESINLLIAEGEKAKRLIESLAKEKEILANESIKIERAKNELSVAEKQIHGLQKQLDADFKLVAAAKSDNDVKLAELSARESAIVKAEEELKIKTAQIKKLVG